MRAVATYSARMGLNRSSDRQLAGINSASRRRREASSAFVLALGFPIRRIAFHGHRRVNILSGPYNSVEGESHTRGGAKQRLTNLSTALTDSRF